MGLQKVKPTRILFLNYEFPPLGGGAATANYYIFKSLKDNHDINITLITASLHESKTEKFSKNITIEYLDVGKNDHNIFIQKINHILMYLVKSIYKAVLLSYKDAYDVSLCFFTFPSGITGLLLKTLFGTPYIISLRGSDVPYFNERFKNIYPLLKPFFHIILHHADYIIANSQDLADLAHQSCAHRNISIIPNGVDTDRFKPAHKKELNSTFLTVSRLIKRKNIQLILEALQKVPQAHLRIVGSGNEFRKLIRYTRENNLEDRVTFVGEVDREKIPLEYQKAGIFILASKNEGMSNALLEAMSSGLAIISTDTGGVKKILGDSMYVFNQDSSDDLARVITEAINETQKMKKLQSKSRQIAETYAWNSISEQYISICKKIVLFRSEM